MRTEKIELDRDDVIEFLAVVDAMKEANSNSAKKAAKAAKAAKKGA